MKHVTAVLLLLAFIDSIHSDLPPASQRFPNAESQDVIDPRLLSHLRSYHNYLSENQRVPYQYYRHISRLSNAPGFYTQQLLHQQQQQQLETRDRPREESRLVDLLREFNSIRAEQPREEPKLDREETFKAFVEDSDSHLSKDLISKKESSTNERPTQLEPVEVTENKVNKFSMLGTSKLVAPDGQRRDEVTYSQAEQYVRPLLTSFGQAGDVYFVAIVAGCSAVAIFGVIGAGYCFYKFQQHSKAAADVDYPAYGVVGPATKETTNTNGLSPSGDRKLAQSAQMYHYHHQKQQMIASEKAATSRHTSASDVDSDEENEEGDYTVYECPGLAPTGEMEVKNPLFQDDVTPVSSPAIVNNNTNTNNSSNNKEK